MEDKTMKAYLMSREEKDGDITLAMAASKAFNVFNDALNQKGAKDEAAMTKLMQARDTTFAALAEAVATLDLSKVRELCNQFQYRLERNWMVPVGKSEIVWDSNQAQAYINAMRSLQSALEHDGGQYKDDKNRVYLAKSRADNLNALVTACLETGAKPKNGIVSGLISFVLRKLDEQRAELVKTGDNGKACGKAKLYGTVEHGFAYLLKQDDRPQQKPTVPQSPEPTLKDRVPEGTHETVSAHVKPPKKEKRTGERQSRRR